MIVHMSPALSIATGLSSNVRQDIGIQVLSRSQPISHLAATHQVSRKFIYQQGDKAQQALDESFAPSKGDDEVLFHLPVTKNWLYQLILGLVLICHSSYRGVVELFRDLFDTPISVGTIHNRFEAAAATATETNQSQDLSGIEVGLLDEIFQSNRPVLVGVDAASTYCYLLQSVGYRDEDTWGWHLLDVMEQGFDPDYTIADGGSGLRAGQKAVLPETPCHGDVFHIQQQFEQVANGLARQTQGATTHRIKLEQRDQLLAFAGVLDQKLADIAQHFELPLQVVRDVCLLHRKSPTSNAYWERWNQLHSKLSGKLYDVMQAVDEALKRTSRARSMVENLNSRLRNYFFLRRSLGDDYLSLLQSFLNHRCFIRSRVPERVGKSPKQLLTGQPHPHWLELLGFECFQRA